MEDAAVIEIEKPETEAEELDVVEESLAYDIMLLQTSVY
jgi:hypothetical protein